ncbi:MAG: LLM class flavin-dependent oxidoreductase, partial [Chloroflexi bacterium]|nr:LLM class flavin-dependent oxidoreductase [Chloroflexota bacterium]
PWEGPILEGWSILAGWAQVTEKASLGLMVGANTFRNPGLTAKLATTLDHLSGGRAVLGVGGAWFEREHEAYGIDFGSGFGERLDRMDESVMLLRRLLDGETVTHEGPVYPMKDALVQPLPIQSRLPIMIGGSGPKKTLRTLARYGDQWNAMGSPEKMAESDAILREHCAAVGRDQAEIERTTTVDIVIRDTRDAAMAAYRARLAVTGEEFDETWNMFLGTPAEIAEGLQPILELGFRHVLVETPAPYDLETIDRIGEVLEQLNG